MAKLNRKNQKLFAGSASNNGVFGSKAAGTPALSNDPDTIQSLGAWATGWLDAVISATKLPCLEDFQSVNYVSTYQLAYLFQEGVPEYNAATTYYTNSIVKKLGTYELWGSRVDDNIGNGLVSGANWQLLCDLSKIAYSGQYVVTTGSSNAYVATPAVPFLSYVAGQQLNIQANFTNTGAATINVSGLGAKDIKRPTGAALLANDILQAGVLSIVYDGTNWQIVSNIIETPVGAIQMYGATTAPNGFFLCNGAAVSRTTYANLFNVIGTTFGAGDGSTTFQLPDMRGYFARGWDNGRGIDIDRVFGSNQADEIKSHTHPTYQQTDTVPGGGEVIATDIKSTPSVYTSQTGSTGGVETRPRNVALMYIIKF